MLSCRMWLIVEIFNAMQPFLARYPLGMLGNLAPNLALTAEAFVHEQ